MTNSGRRAGPAQPRAARHGGAGLPQHRPSSPRRCRPPSRPPARCSPPNQEDSDNERRLLRELGGGHSSPNTSGLAPAARARTSTRAATRSTRRSTASSRTRRRPSSTTRFRRAPAGPPRRWSRSTTRPARCARWSAATTSTRTRSTSRPRPSASRARRSRSSTSRRRSSTATPPNSQVLSDPFTYTGQIRTRFGAFSVHNDEGGYYDVKIPLWEALAVSDNTVFARLGLSPSVGTRLVAQLRPQLRHLDDDLDQPVDGHRRPAIGVTPLDMAHAYETIANGGLLTTGSLVSDSCAGVRPARIRRPIAGRRPRRRATAARARSASTRSRQAARWSTQRTAHQPSPSLSLPDRPERDRDDAQAS